MKLLGVSSHANYKIVFYLDYLAMISVHTPKYGVIQVLITSITLFSYKRLNETKTNSIFVKKYAVYIYFIGINWTYHFHSIGETFRSNLGQISKWIPTIQYNNVWWYTSKFHHESSERLENKTIQTSTSKQSYRPRITSLNQVLCRFKKIIIM